MKETIIELRELTATPGKWLTNGEIYSKRLYLGINDDKSNYYEITDAEYEEIEAKKQPQEINE